MTHVLSPSCDRMENILFVRDLEHQCEDRLRLRILSSAIIATDCVSIQFVGGTQRVVFSGALKRFIVIAAFYGVVGVASVSAFKIWRAVFLWCHMVASLFALFKIQNVGPGFVGAPQETDETSKNERIRLPSGAVVFCQFCKTCKCLRPPRTSHCRTCNACVAQFDHHCHILCACIGRDNIGFFFAFLLLAWSLAVFSAIFSVLEIGELSLVVLSLAVLSAVPLLSLLCFCCRLYCWLGVTHREWRRRGENFEGHELDESWSVVPRPFNLGLKNCCHYLL